MATADNDIVCHVRTCSPEFLEDSILSVYPQRKSISLSDQHDTDFSIISYNLLAQCYAFKSRYPYTKSISQEFRHQNLMKELHIIGAGTIICFQEVTQKYFSSLLQPAMNTLGYLSVFKPRPGKSVGASPGKDGLAIFYRKDRAELIEIIPLELNALLQEVWLGMYGSDSVLPTECYRDTLALVLVLRINNAIVVVGTTHLPWTKVYWDEQTLQVSLILKRLAEIAATHESNAYVLCGDFNRNPQYELYQYVTTGKLTQPQRELFMSSKKKLSIPNIIHGTECLNSSGDVSKVILPLYKVFENFYNIPEPMHSAYAAVLGEEPKFTFYADSHGCMDYIFYSSALMAVSVLSVPSKEEVSSETSLPNSVMSSDHISIKAVCRFV
ncbi:Mucin-17-like [Oopsacas minuta]|uniref:Mucin-17-like n=1 Tax=Oopsacas minuta TaxID=111878 RepID=A0AAV7K3C1_9METZ|nr:Mucin-17-like [Oopsacas minuta]